MTVARDTVDVSKILTVAELQAIAKERLPPGAYVYVAGGAGDERTMRDNIEAFARWRFLPRVLVDTSARTLSTSVLGQRIAVPVGIAPFALQGLLDAEGEVATARAATAAKTFIALSMGANRTIEEVAAICAASVATAVNSCVPGTGFVIGRVYGLAVEIPKDWPFKKNSTCLMLPLLSPASAVTATCWPIAKRAPLVGDAILTNGRPGVGGTTVSVAGRLLVEPVRSLTVTVYCPALVI